MVKKAVRRGRSEQRGEAYPCGTLSLFAMREQSWRAFSPSCYLLGSAEHRCPHDFYIGRRLEIK
jgi:hypothetical protein